jgi:hypothetical protein
MSCRPARRGAIQDMRRMLEWAAADILEVE